MNDMEWKVSYYWLNDLANSIVKVPPKIVIDSYLVRQFRKPRSKRKRIQKKWAKVSSNYKADDRVFQIGKQFLCHPSVFAKLRRHLRQNGYAMQDEVSTCS